jgi:hypothetical protein
MRSAFLIFVFLFIQSFCLSQNNSNVQKKDTVDKFIKFGLGITAGINPNPRILHFPHYLYDNKNENAFMNFKFTPGGELIYISKNNFIHQFDFSYLTGKNVMNNPDTANSLTNTKVSYSLLYPVSIRINNKLKVSAYGGLSISYSKKDMSYQMNYYEETNTYIPTYYNYLYKESANLVLMQVPAGVLLFHKSWIFNAGFSLNLIGAENGKYSSRTISSKTKTKDPNVINESDNYSNPLLIGGSMNGKFLVDNLFFKIDYVFKKNLNHRSTTSSAPNQGGKL